MPRAYLVAVAAAVLALLTVQIALAGGSASPGGPEAAASSAVKKKLKSLQRQINALKAQAGSPGPQGAQGAQGAAGSAPACKGNDAGDVMVKAGAVCIDRYEASVWSSPTGGTQYGVSSDDYPCSDNGQDCTNIYARSVAGVTPSSDITWFQAQQALANSGKRLATNAEWQQGVAGTPDPGAAPGAEDCNTNSIGSVATGSRDNCISNHGANDMVGNLWEWVADWDEEAGATCTTWPPGFGDDFVCIGRADSEASTRFPAALIRGGSYTLDAGAGPFAVVADDRPSSSSGFTPFGFRGAR